MHLHARKTAQHMRRQHAVMPDIEAHTSEHDVAT